MPQNQEATTSNPTNTRWTAVPDSLPVLLTTREAAGLLGVTPKHVRSLLAEGVLAGARIGGTWRVNRDALLIMAGLV